MLHLDGCRDFKMNFKLCCFFILVFTLFLIPFYEPIFAYTTEHIVSINSEKIQFGPVVIQVNYTVFVDVDKPIKLKSGDPFTLLIYPNNGYLEYTIDILGNTYSISQDLNLGDDVTFDIISGIEAYVSTSASSFVTITGPVNNNEQTLYWDNPTSQIIQSSINEDIGDFENIFINIPMNINIDTGLNLNILGMIKQNIVKQNLGVFSAYPTIVETIPITDTVIIHTDSNQNDIFKIIFISVVIINIIIITFVLILIYKKRRN